MYLEIFDSQDSWTLTRFVSMHHLPPLPPYLGAGGKERGRRRRDLPIYTHGRPPTPSGYASRPCAAGLPVIHGGLVTVEFGW